MKTQLNEFTMLNQPKEMHQIFFVVDHKLKNKKIASASGNRRKQSIEKPDRKTDQSPKPRESS